jgi:FAD-dependent sensor of blue light
VIQLIYRSAARVAFNERQLSQLLSQARDNNLQRGLTGMLLYDEGSFLQVLEGESEHLLALYTRILLDPRHVDIAKLLEREIQERQFGAWQMGFVSAARLGVTIPGYSDFLKNSALTAAPGNQALRVLSQFREGRFRSQVET